jgi:hypothetical protein
MQGQEIFRDTTCAIVGGIVVLHAGPDAIAFDWLLRREALPGPST